MRQHHRHPADGALLDGVGVFDPTQPAVVHLGGLSGRTLGQAHGMVPICRLRSINGDNIGALLRQVL